MSKALPLLARQEDHSAITHGLRTLFVHDVLHCSHTLREVNEEKFNMPGGSIPCGQPFAATAARMITQTLNELRRRGGSPGLITVYAVRGSGGAMVLEAEE